MFVGTTLTCATPPSGIGGSGTDNYIHRWSGTNVLENSVIYQTDAGNVGIGTPEPAAKLEVVAPAGVDALRLKRGSSNTWVIGPGSGTGDETKLGIWDTSTRLVIDSTGNVGINQTSPGAKLDVNGDVIIRGTELTFGGTEKLARIITNGQDFHIAPDWSGSGGTGIIYIGFNADAATTRRISIGEGTTVTNTTFGGNVGIGTTGPDSKLHVIGGACVESSDNGCAASAGNLNVLGNVGIGVSGAPVPKLIIEQTGTNDAFRVNDQVGDSTPFIIDADGNVKVGGDLKVGGGIGIGEGRVSGYYINTPTNFDVTTGGVLSANSANISGNLTAGMLFGERDCKSVNVECSGGCSDQTKTDDSICSSWATGAKHVATICLFGFSDLPNSVPTMGGNNVGEFWGDGYNADKQVAMCRDGSGRDAFVICCK